MKKCGRCGRHNRRRCHLVDGNGRYWRLRTAPAVRQQPVTPAIRIIPTSTPTQTPTTMPTATSTSTAEPHVHASAYQYTDTPSDPYADSHQHPDTYGHSAADSDAHVNRHCHSDRDLYAHVTSTRVRPRRTHVDGSRQETRSLLHSYPHA